MKTIIINGQRELAELPEKWYTDGTDEANEWAKALWDGFEPTAVWIGNAQSKNFIGAIFEVSFREQGHTYITPSEFDRLVYQPWKEGQKVKLPTTYEELTDMFFNGKIGVTWHPHGMIPHIQACIQLTNIMTFANDAFEGDESYWEVQSGGYADSYAKESICHPIRFTSKEGAEWAYKTFPEIFKAYWNV